MILASNKEVVNKGITIIEATDAKLRELIYGLRYSVSIEEMNKKLPNVDHINKMVYDELDNDQATLLCALNQNGQPVATLRIIWSELGLSSNYKDYYSLDKFAHFSPKSFSFTSRLVIHRLWRRSNLLAQLAFYSYRLFRERKVQFNFCHSKPELAHFYERLGYQRYDRVFIDPFFGPQIRLVLVTEDIAHLKYSQSILLKIAKTMPGQISPA